MSALSELGYHTHRTQIMELGQTILNLTNLVPNGFVVFLPSYSFLSLVKAAWSKGETKILDRLGKKKKVRESYFLIIGFLRVALGVLRTSRERRRGQRAERIFSCRE